MRCCGARINAATPDGRCGIGCGVADPGRRPGAVAFESARFADELVVLERASGGRLGLAILDRATGARFARRGDERFPMCSTFKALLVGAVLARVDAGKERLDRSLAIVAGDIVDHSPMAERRVGDTATVEELCRATMTLSDNAAANLLLPAVGGPPGLTRFVRKLGAVSTRLDRLEPKLNDVPAGDARDSTTPMEMVALIDKLALGAVLAPSSRALLLRWLVDTETGVRRLRAGLPDGWRVGDRTGAWERGTTDNVVAVVWPPARPPLVIASYIADARLPFALTNAIHASVGRLIVEAVTGRA